MLTTGGTHLEPDVVRGREVRLEADGVVHRLLPGLDRGGYLGGGSRIVHRVVGVGVLSRHLLLPSVGWTHEGGAYVFFPKRRARPPRLLYARGLPVLVTLSMRQTVRTMSAAEDKNGFSARRRLPCARRLESTQRFFSLGLHTFFPLLSADDSTQNDDSHHHQEILIIRVKRVLNPKCTVYIRSSPGDSRSTDERDGTSAANVLRVISVGIFETEEKCFYEGMDIFMAHAHSVLHARRWVAFRTTMSKARRRSAFAPAPASSLHQAAASGDVASAARLLDASDEQQLAPVDLPSHIAASVKVDVNSGREDLMGRAPLHVAADKGHAEMSAFLVGRGADVDARDAVRFLGRRSTARGGTRDMWCTHIGFREEVVAYRVHILKWSTCTCCDVKAV